MYLVLRWPLFVVIVWGTPPRSASNITTIPGELMDTTRFHRVVIAGVAALVVGGTVVGCGASGSKPTAATTTATGAAVAADSAAATTKPAAKAGGDKNSKFCQELAQIAASTANIQDDSSDSTDDLKQIVQTYDAVRGSLLSSAPSAIKPDVTTLFNYLDQYYGALAKAGYDPSKMDPTVLAGLVANAQSLETAGDNITSYVKTTCGIDLDAGASSPS
jgi:hypothetical protein